MLTGTRNAFLWKIIAIYMLVYPVVARLQWLANWWTDTAEFGHPGHSSAVAIGVYLYNAFLLAWLPLSYFVWRGHRWARWSVIVTALVLGLSEYFLFADMLTLYMSASLISQMLLAALPMFLLSAIALYALAGAGHSVTNASNQAMQPTADRLNA